MHWGRIILAVLILGGAGYGIYAFKNQVKTYPEALKTEIGHQEREKQQCRERLNLFYAAFNQFKADHKGAEPSSIESLVPKHVAVESLVCPTAKRWAEAGKPLEQGEFKVDGKFVQVTYGLRWLATGYSRDVKRNQGKAILVVCQAHSEGLYRAAYNKRPTLDAYMDEKRVNLVDEVRDSKNLALHRDGTIDEIPAGE